jgi:hypothetical protein
LEFRVWEQYQHSADDFGVMRMSYLTIQDDNAALAKRPPKVISRALEAIVNVKLVEPFTHQNRAYLCQLDWQDYQKKGYTKRTQLPKPPDALLALCTALTQHLFGFHPGGVSIPKFSEKVSKFFPKSSENISKSLENISSTRETHTQTQPLPRPQPQTLRTWDEEWAQFKSVYPGLGREGGYMATQRFIAACEKVGFAVVLAGAERYRRSKRVRDGYVLGLEKWLEKECWIQEPGSTDDAQSDLVNLAQQHLAKEAERKNRG